MFQTKIIGPCEKLLRAHPRPWHLSYVAGYLGRTVIRFRQAGAGAKQLQVELGEEDTKRLRRELLADTFSLKDSVLLVLDAFALEGRSGFTSAQREALAELERAWDRVRNRSAGSDQEEAIAGMRASTLELERAAQLRAVQKELRDLIHADRCGAREDERCLELTAILGDQP
jgi:hypothetical protein